MAKTSVEVFQLKKNLESSLFDGFDFADKLVEFVLTTLEELDWDGEITVTKRYGNLFAKKARQKRLLIKGKD